MLWRHSSDELRPLFKANSEQTQNKLRTISEHSKQIDRARFKTLFSLLNMLNKPYLFGTRLPNERWGSWWGSLRGSWWDSWESWEIFIPKVRIPHDENASAFWQTTRADSAGKQGPGGGKALRIKRVTGDRLSADCLPKKQSETRRLSDDRAADSSVFGQDKTGRKSKGEVNDEVNDEVNEVNDKVWYWPICNVHFQREVFPGWN